MKIALTLPSLGGGGAERIAATLASGWAQRGHTVTVVTLDEARQEDYPLSPTVHRVGLGLLRPSEDFVQGVVTNGKRLIALRGFLRRARPDVVLGMTSEIAILSTLAATGLPTIVIASERTHPPMMPLPRHWAWLRRKVYPRADAVAMLTQEGGAWLGQEIPNAHAIVMPNPVTWPMLDPAPGPSPATLLDAGDRVVLMAGRLIASKRFDLAIESFARVAAAVPRSQLVILGEGEERSRLEALARELDLETRVRLPGRVSNLGDWYQRAELLLVTSRFEGFPNIITEAMAHACPVISVDCPTGPRDLITDGQDGLLLPANPPPQQIADAVIRLFSDEATRAAMSARAIAVRDRYSLDSILGRWGRIFEELGLQANQRSLAREAG